MYPTKITINLTGGTSVRGILAEFAEMDGDKERPVGTKRIAAADVQGLLPTSAEMLAQIAELQERLAAEKTAREEAEKARDAASQSKTAAEADRDAKVAAAEAERDAKVAAAESSRAAAVTEAEANRDVAGARAARDAEKARADAEAAKVAALEARIAELTAPPADPEISDRQLFQQLAIEGEITEDEAEAAVATGTIPEAMMALVQSLPAEQQFGARMMLKGATTIKRRHPMTALIGQLYGKDDAWLDRFFAAASAL